MDFMQANVEFSGASAKLQPKPRRSQHPLERIVMQKFIVTVTNEILGNSRREMTLDQIKKFNLCAYLLAVKSAKNDGQEYSDGMWTVRAA